jgi:nicotinamide-nucleotide amidase
MVKAMQNHLPWAEETASLVRRIAAAAQARGATIAAAESCTGGLLSSALIDQSGASAFFIEGIVSYANSSKVSRLGVSQETLDTFGAVSAQTAQEMARGAALGSGATIGISTTGIAGPEGGTPEKPVGLVFFGLYRQGRSSSQRQVFAGTRNEVRRQAVLHALSMILEELNCP